MNAGHSQDPSRWSKRRFRFCHILGLSSRRVCVSADVGNAMRGRMLPVLFLGTNGIADDDMAAALPAEGPN